MTEPTKTYPPKWLLACIYITAIPFFVVLCAFVKTAIQKVSAGQGLDTFHTYWLVEFNYIGALVLFGTILLVLVIAWVLRLYEYFQWRSLEKKYGKKNENT